MSQRLDNLSSFVSEVDISEFQSKYVEQVMEAHSDLVFSLAFDLTSDMELANQVVSDVFVRLHRERETCADEPIRTLLHRFTYDIAIAKLVERTTSEVPLIN